MSFFEKFGRSAMELKSVRCLTVTGVLIALDLVLKMLSIKITSDLKITFAFIALATVGMLFGPVVSFIAGALTDIIGFFLTADGGFSPLFTLIEAVGAMIYGMFLYDIKPVRLEGITSGERSGSMGKTILISLAAGVCTAALFAAAVFGISGLLAPYTDAEGQPGKIAAVMTDPALIVAAAAVGFLYGVFFAVVIHNSSGEKTDVKSSVRVVVSKIIVVVVCNLIMTPIAMVASGYMTMDSMIAAYPLRLVKNAIQCPLDCLILLIVLFPVLAAYKRIFRDSISKSDKNEQGRDLIND